MAEPKKFSELYKESSEFNDLRIGALLNTLKEIKKDISEIERHAKNLVDNYINFEGEYIPEEDNELLRSIIKLRKRLPNE
tara:strand:- start:5349 stop:5588 length:240 start_codon:yes stop_codon:yes gene_type:complete